MNYRIKNFSRRGRDRHRVSLGVRTLYIGEGVFPEHKIEKTIEVLKRLNTNTPTDLKAMRKEKV